MYAMVVFWRGDKCRRRGWGKCGMLVLDRAICSAPQCCMARCWLIRGPSLRLSSFPLRSRQLQSTAVHCHVPQTVWRERAVHYSVRACVCVCVCPISLHVSCRRPTSVYCRSAAVAAGYERPGRAGQSAGGWAATEECPLPARGDGARRVTDRRRGGGHGDYASTRYHRRRRVCDFPAPRETDDAVPLWSPAG